MSPMHAQRHISRAWRKAHHARRRVLFEDAPASVKRLLLTIELFWARLTFIQAWSRLKQSQTCAEKLD